VNHWPKIVLIVDLNPQSLLTIILILSKNVVVFIMMSVSI